MAERLNAASTDVKAWFMAIPLTSRKKKLCTFLFSPQAMGTFVYGLVLSRVVEN